jgi:Cu(I)/Ag(I) efflux system membrane fusion protein
MKKYLKIIIIVASITVLAIGGIWLWKSNKSQSIKHVNDSTEIYTCPMHPQIIRNEPGDCPICGMKLVKKNIKNSDLEKEDLTSVIQRTDKFIISSLTSTNPIDTSLSTKIKLPGVVSYDPNSAVTVAARVSGRLEKLFVRYKFQYVKKGQKLFEIYSPELLTEQNNFIYLLKNDSSNTAIINASTDKLLLYGMSSNQINNLQKTLKANPIIAIYSPIDGIIQESDNMNAETNNAMDGQSLKSAAINLKEGSYISKNAPVFKLFNTKRVWAVFNLMQDANSLVSEGSPIIITSETDNKLTISKTVNYIETQIKTLEKSNSIRIYIDNTILNLPIGARLTGEISSPLINGIYIKKDSYISIGEKSLVFIKQNDGYIVHEIKTGYEIGKYVQVIEGLTIKDKIAENAQYLIDSESFVKIEKK